MPNDTRRSGSCLCGGIQFSVTGDPFRIGLCHCKDCRKASGSTFSAFAVWPLEAFETTGIVSSYGDRSFCPTCGGRVPLVRENEVEVTIGSLDEVPTEALEPSYELWINRREHWLQPLPGARQFEHDRVEDGPTNDGLAAEPVSEGAETPLSHLSRRKSA